MSPQSFPVGPEKCGRPLHARIVATASALPDKVVTNDDIISEHGHRVSGDTIEKMIGVRKRRVAQKGIVDSDLLADAARGCLAKSNISADSLSKIIVTRFLGDRLLPMTAAFVQKKLGLTTAVQALDINGGTHSFLQALHAGACAVESDGAPVLVVSGGIVNRLASRTDPRTAFLYGDGAAAVLLAPSKDPCFLGTFGFSNYEYAASSAAFRMEDYSSTAADASVDRAELFDVCRPFDWKGLKDVVSQGLAVTAQTLLSEARKTASEVDFWFVTENHHRLHRAVLDRLDIPSKKNLSLIAETGNTMSAMLPMQLDEAIARGSVSAGNLVMMLSVGEGIQGGGILLTL